MYTPPPFFENENQRRRAVAWVVALAATLPTATQRNEYPLYQPSPPGELTLSEASPPLETDVYRVLYRSSATNRSSNQELLELLEEAHQFNRKHQITGMLLYSEGQFVQAIEGPQDVVLALYGRIQHDARHQQVETVREGPIPSRQFAEWSMDFGFAALFEPKQAGSLLAQPAALPGLSTTSAHLKVLMEAFIG